MYIDILLTFPNRILEFEESLTWNKNINIISIFIPNKINLLIFMPSIDFFNSKDSFSYCFLSFQFPIYSLKTKYFSPIFCLVKQYENWKNLFVNKTDENNLYSLNKMVKKIKKNHKEDVWGINNITQNFKTPPNQIPHPHPWLKF